MKRRDSIIGALGVVLMICCITASIIGWLLVAKYVYLISPALGIVVLAIPVLIGVGVHAYLDFRTGPEYNETT